MAHNLFSSRFYQNRTQPAWHGLGINSDQPMTATEALEAVGSYNISLHPMTVQIEGEARETGFNMIMRHPTSDDPIYRQFGNPVTGSYELITPQDACQLWDSKVKDAQGASVPVETFGVLGKGERMFISVKLPSFDVKGDQIDTYMLYDNPMIPGIAIGVYTTPVRTVCQNTLTAGIGKAIIKKQIDHNKGATQYLAGWLETIYANALEAREVLAEAYNILAAKPVTDMQVRWIIEQAYPLPKAPTEESRSRLSVAERYVNYEYWKGIQERVRDTVYGLYEGGTGMDTRAVQGTAFGAWNAVAEFETYRRGPATSAGEKLINGDRARTIRTAFNLAMEADKFEMVMA